jgi:5'-3' exonuclease
MLKDGGVVPNRNQIVELESRTEPEPDSEQAAIKRIAVALVQGAIERHRYFGLPLEEADECEEALNQKAKGKNGHG